MEAQQQTLPKCAHWASNTPRKAPDRLTNSPTPCYKNLVYLFETDFEY